MKNIIILIVSVLALTACNKTAEENPEQPKAMAEDVIQLTSDQLKTIEIVTTQLQAESLNSTIHLNGRVDAVPSDVVSVTSALGGYVKKINVLPGSNFNKGQLLAVLEDNQFIQLQQDYLATQVQLKVASLNFERQKELNQSKASSDKTLQQAEAEYRTLVVAQKALEQKLALIHIDHKTVTSDNIKSTINIYAPFSGTVSEMFVNTGKYVSPSETLFELVNSKGLIIKIKAFEKDLPFLKIGQSLRFNTNEKPDLVTDARIISIGQTVAEDGSTDILARPADSSYPLILGMYINAEIGISNKRTFVLPEESIVMFENKWYVFEQLTQQTFKIREVETGIKENNFVEILNPDALQGKTMVAKSAYTLLMALKNKAEE